MTDLLVTGSDGQLGRALERIAGERGVATAGHDVDTLDITDRDAVATAVSDIRPVAVVNCAAYTAVDRCEEDAATAEAVNAIAVGHLAEACGAVGATLVHLSTDYVFDGTATRPYRTDDPLEPASVYGRTKAAGEREAGRAPSHLIVRTAWLYGRGGWNFVEAIRRQVDEGAEELRVVADQYGNPTFADDLATAILDLVEVGALGVVHVVNRGTTTWHGFAVEIVRQLGGSTPVRAVSTDEFPRPAPRPAYSVLDTTRLERILGRTLPPWQDGLARYLEPGCGS